MRLALGCSSVSAVVAHNDAPVGEGLDRQHFEIGRHSSPTLQQEQIHASNNVQRHSFSAMTETKMDTGHRVGYQTGIGFGWTSS